MSDEAVVENEEQYIDIVFDGPPAHESGRFVEVEDNEGNSLNIGAWVQRSDGYWVLRINWDAIGEYYNERG